MARTDMEEGVKSKEEGDIYVPWCDPDKDIYLWRTQRGWVKGSEAERVGGRQADEKEMGLIGWDGAEIKVSGEKEEVEPKNKGGMIK